MNLKQLRKRIKDLEDYTDNVWHYWGDKIPENMLSKAKQAHTIENDYCFYLYDLTVWGSAKVGILATNRGLSFKYKSKIPALFLSWESIEDFEIEGQRARIKSNGKLYSFEFCDKPFQNDFNALLSELAQEKKTKFSADLDMVKYILNEAESASETHQIKKEISKAIRLCDDLLKSCEITPLEVNYKAGDKSYIKTFN